MNSGPGGVSRLKLGGQADPEDRKVSSEKITAGVPLVKLIKRRMVEVPELVMLNRARSVAAEQFRRLKTLLVNEYKDSAQVIVITSPAPGEGKSMVSANLALAFAADLQGAVLLLDADLRRPTVERWLTPIPKLGLTEILTGQTELDHAVLELENSALNVLPAGTPPHDPVELLSSDSAKNLMAKLRERYSRIIVDTPPIIPFTDADAIGSYCDGILVVARSGATRQSMYLQALASVTSTRLLGSVLNDVTFNLADREHYHYENSYYDYYDRERKR
jgi:capsular exopolysaccharide synthesis family protein